MVLSTIAYIILPCLRIFEENKLLTPMFSMHTNDNVATKW